MRKNLKKHPSLLIEVLVAFALIALCMVPLIGSQLAAYRARTLSLAKIHEKSVSEQLFREFQLAFVSPSYQEEFSKKFHLPFQWESFTQEPLHYEGEFVWHTFTRSSPFHYTQTIHLQPPPPSPYTLDTDQYKLLKITIELASKASSKKKDSFSFLQLIAKNHSPSVKP